ncbi:exonuclease domain-containing protein [Cytobacillus firmus]|uniref:exonuclease domain-containing protein n=1 Tax=Cytobacillus firmus TaxID=1399 RepID=UPI0021C591D7|nr:exonuclease domain-containing protein [Cytobacillus firmus]MCU1804791.1 exonuclease domain-containing protein [Cytobacillus firmus]
MDFIAIDFEIANENLYSACSVGLAIVENNQIVDEQYYLIKPPNLKFDESFSAIHGITPRDVLGARNFDEVWELIKHYFQDATIVAHNAQFDMSVLHAALKKYQIPLPDFEYICSIPISTRACRGQGVGQSLEERLAYFNIALNNHHNALSDARACAELVTTCIRMKKRKNLMSYCSTYSSIPVKRFSELKPQDTFSKRKKFSKVRVSEIAATVENFDETHVLFGKNIVFTGDLQSISRNEAMQKAVDLGAIIKTGVSKKTDYLVVGIQDKSLVGTKGISTKEEKAYFLIKEGININIINESAFLNLINC